MERPASGKSGAAEPYELVRPYLLTVDVSMTQLDIYRAFLEKDYEILDCMSGRRAFEIMDQMPVAVVIVGMELADTNGMNFLIMKNGKKELKEIPVLVVSSDLRPEMEELAFIYGAQGYLTKPVSRDVLCKTLAALVCSDVTGSE
jgi:response regulator RpfG family c-di-GMP phosphodiesterase